MSPAVERLYQAALLLPEDDRLELADALFLAMGEPPAPELIGDAYAAEVRRRSAEADPAIWSTWADAMRRVHAQLGLREPGDG